MFHGCCLFLKDLSVTLSHDFGNQIKVVMLVTHKQKVQRKSDSSGGVIFFSNFNAVRKRCLNDGSFLLGFFCSHAAFEFNFLLKL